MKSDPLVACLTNTVAANFTANCILALGARPVMIEEVAEVRELAALADALLVNLGTLNERQAEMMRLMVQCVREQGVPWVLDPVGIQALSFRRDFAFELLQAKPTIIRGNAAEIAVFLGSVPTGTVVLSTGAVDKVVDNSEVVEVSGGAEMLKSVTATGCAQGGICAALLGRGLPPREAALTASRLMKRAGEAAWARAHSPGSFQVALLDALWELDHA